MRHQRTTETDQRAARLDESCRRSRLAESFDPFASGPSTTSALQPGCEPRSGDQDLRISPSTVRMQRYTPEAIDGLPGVSHHSAKDGAAPSDRADPAESAAQPSTALSRPRSAAQKPANDCLLGVPTASSGLAKLAAQL